MNKQQISCGGGIELTHFVLVMDLSM